MGIAVTFCRDARGPSGLGFVMGSFFNRLVSCGSAVVIAPTLSSLRTLVEHASEGFKAIGRTCVESKGADGVARASHSFPIQLASANRRGLCLSEASVVVGRLLLLIGDETESIAAPTFTALLNFPHAGALILGTSSGCWGIGNTDPRASAGHVGEASEVHCFL